MPGLRWSELEDPIRVSSLLGIVSGGSGIIALGFLAVQEAYYVQIVLASFLPLLLIPLLTGLSLLFLKLTNEQRGVMGFVCFVSSLFIMVADYFLLFFAYCLCSSLNLFMKREHNSTLSAPLGFRIRWGRLFYRPIRQTIASAKLVTTRPFS